MSDKARAILFSLSLIFLSACGQTGALVLPGTQPAPAADTSASAEPGDEDETEQ